MGRKARRITLTVLVAIIVLICVVCAIPFITVPYLATETYQDIEITREPYTAAEPYVTSELTEREETVFDDTPYSVPYGISVPFIVSRDNTRLTGNFALPASGGFYLYSAGKIIYEQLGQQGKIDIPVPKGQYEARLREGLSWSEKVNLILKLKWSEMAEVTRYNDITRYRDIHAIVEKQRTVTKDKVVSIWEIVFRK